MFDKIKKSLLKFPKKMKDVNNGDTVAEYRAFKELHQFIEEFVIGGLYLFKIKELHSLYVQELTELGIENCTSKTVLKENILDLFRITHSQNAGNGAIIASNEIMQSMLKML